MIWLRKKRNTRIYNEKKNGDAEYLTELMEPFETYIESIRQQEVSKDVVRDAQFQIYQLMEIYISCRAVAEWLSLDSEEDKTALFNNFENETKLKKILDTRFNYISKSEYRMYPKEMKKNLKAIFNENISDFRKAFEGAPQYFREAQSDDNISRSEGMECYLSFYINQGIWTALRLFPSSYCKADKIVHKDVQKDNFDFISRKIFYFDESFNLWAIENNREFYEQAAEESFLDLIELLNYLYSDSNIKISDIEKDKENTAILAHEFHDFKDEITKKIEEIERTITKKEEKYRTMSMEELISIFYETFDVPKDFLLILQEIPFEGNIILSEDFRFRYGYQTLVISYLDYKSPKNKDMALIKCLFNIDAKNPAAAKKPYAHRLDDFKNFIKENSKNI